MASLAESYIAGESTLNPFFQAVPSDLEHWTLPDATWDADLVHSIEEYNAFLGAPKTVPTDAIAIVTGQQAAIFGGPLYTIYKAMTAVKLAERFAHKIDRSVVPVFWLSGDDHDFEEARDTYLLSKHDEMVPLRYQPNREPKKHITL